MIKKFIFPLLLVCAVCFCACSKDGGKTAGEDSAQISTKPESMAYINTLLDTTLKIKFFINDYMIKNNAWPETLKVLDYPGMTFISSQTFLPDGSQKELITGVLEDDKIYVRYEPTSFGKKGSPMLSVTHSKEFSKDMASIQWVNDVLSCVAYGTSAFSNEACKTLKKTVDHSNPLRNYYTLDDAVSQEHKMDILAQVDDMLTEVTLKKARNPKKTKK